MSQEEAERITNEWLAAWNRHDLNAVMLHYAEGIEFTSPFVTTLLGEAAGTVRGKSALRGYFARALEAYPELCFELIRVFPGVQSLVAHYRSVRGLLAAEVMLLDDEGRVCRVLAHYYETKQEVPPR